MFPEGNAQISGQPVGPIFTLNASDQEIKLQHRFTDAYIHGAHHRNIVDIVNDVERHLVTAFCEFQNELNIVMDAIKNEKRQNPQAAKKFDAILSRIRKCSENAQHRVEYFLQIWKHLVDFMLRLFPNNQQAAILAAPILELHASTNGEQLARMVFRDRYECANAVSDAVTRIANINRIVNTIHNTEYGP